MIGTKLAGFVLTFTQLEDELSDTDHVEMVEKHPDYGEFKREAYSTILINLPI